MGVWWSFLIVGGSPWLWWILLSDDDELWWRWWMSIHESVSFNSGEPFRQWWTRLFNAEFKKAPRSHVVGVVASFYTDIRGRRNSSCHSSSGVVCMLSCSCVPHVGSSSLKTSRKPPKKGLMTSNPTSSCDSSHQFHISAFIGATHSRLCSSIPSCKTKWN